jgi:hypothetical protein
MSEVVLMNAEDEPLNGYVLPVVPACDDTEQKQTRMMIDKLFPEREFEQIIGVKLLHTFKTKYGVVCSIDLQKMADEHNRSFRETGLFVPLTLGYGGEKVGGFVNHLVQYGCLFAEAFVLSGRTDELRLYVHKSCDIQMPAKQIREVVFINKKPHMVFVENCVSRNEDGFITGAFPMTFASQTFTATSSSPPYGAEDESDSEIL